MGHPVNRNRAPHGARCEGATPSHSPSSSRRSGPNITTAGKPAAVGASAQFIAVDAFGSIATALLHASVRSAAARPSLTRRSRPSLAALGRAGSSLRLRSAAALALAQGAINGKKI